jgi:PsbP-like protein
MRRISCLLIVLLISSSLVHPEEIELKDGSKISGKLTAVEGNVFRVKTAYGEIQVPRSEVVQIRFPENAAKTESGNGDSKTSESQVDESLDGTTYSNRTAHFQVNVPHGWALAPEMRQKEIVAALKSDDQAQFFMVTPEKYAGSLKTYQLLAETQIQNNFQEFEKLSEAPAKLDDRNGMRIIFKAKKGTMAFKFLVYILPYDGLMVRLSFFTLEPLYNDAEPVFEKIAQSYHSTSDKPVT